jgi:hypothetical protein
MKYVIPLFLLTSCTAAPDFFKAADDVLTDDAITIKVDRDAIREGIDVHVLVDVVNGKTSVSK